MPQKLSKYKYHTAPLVVVSVNEIISKLPPVYQWSVELTDDTLGEIPAEFRIYVNSEDERVALRGILKFERPAEQTDISETHKYSRQLVVTIIEI